MKIRDLSVQTFLPAILLLLLLSTSQLTQAQDKWEAEMQAMVSLVDAAIDAGNYEIALDSLHGFQARIAQGSSNDSLLGMVHHKLGVLHYYLYQYDDALKYLSLAIQYRQDIPVAQGQSHFVHSVVFQEMGQLQNAIGALQKSMAILTQTQPVDSLGLADHHRELARLYMKSGELSRAEEYFLSALQLYEAPLGPSSEEAADIYNDLGILYSEWKNYGEAIRQWERARELFRLLDKEWFAFPIANCQRNLGLAYSHQGYFSKAISYLEEALKLYQHIYAESQQKEILSAISGTYDNLGLVYGKMKNYPAAEKWARRSVNLHEAEFPSYHPELAKSYDNLGDIYLDQKKALKALKQYQMAMQTIVPELTEQGAYPDLIRHSIGDPSGLVKYLWGTAQAYHLAYRQKMLGSEALSQATIGFEKADSLIAQLRKSYQSEASKIFLAENLSPLYEQAINLAYHLYQETANKEEIYRAYHYMEKSKALSLLESRQRLQAAELAAVPDSLIDTERTLGGQILVLEQQILQEKQSLQPDSAQLSHWYRERFKLREDLEKLQHDIHAHYPKFKQLSFSQEIPELITLQASLSEACMLMYFCGEESWYSISINRDQAHFTKVQDLALVAQALQHYLDERAEFPPQQVFDSQSWSAPLFQLLLSGPLARASATESIKQLIIIPDGPLHYLPFSALTSRPLEHSRDYQAYMMGQYSLKFSPSASLYWADRGYMNTANPQKSFLGIAPKYDHTKNEEKQGWPDLADARQASQQIAQHLHGETQHKSPSSIQQFQDWIKDYKVLHFATHGQLFDEDPLSSGLVLGDESPGDYSYLSAADIYSLEIQARLVVLSACETGLGEVKRGEGIMSLSRAFAYAGCPALLASLWQVPSKETSEIMLAYYENLADEIESDEALRQAQIRYIQQGIAERLHPYYWAGWSFSGKAESLKLSPAFGQLYGWALGVFILFLLGILVWGFLKRSKTQS